MGLEFEPWQRLRTSVMLSRPLPAVTHQVAAVRGPARRKDPSRPLPQHGNG